MPGKSSFSSTMSFSAVFTAMLLSGYCATSEQSGDGLFELDRTVMSDGYWSVWNDAEQAKIDADIEKNRKADAELVFCAAPGSEVKIEQLDHEFRFGAHIFNFDQLGKKEYNDAYKASYGEGGLFNQATVAFYWNKYEPIPGRLRAFGDYEDTERFWNSLTREEAMDHPFWRRPAPGPVIEYLKRRDIAIHGHILVWGLAKPFWIYDEFCPEDEKRAFDAIGITPAFGVLRKEGRPLGGRLLRQVARRLDHRLRFLFRGGNRRDGAGLHAADARNLPQARLRRREGFRRACE